LVVTIESAGTIVCHLPPYAPGLDPIEKRWSEGEEILRSLKARSEEARLEAVGVARRGLTTTDPEAWFEHCGYGSTQYLNRSMGKG
jgi:hypothetical protein